MGLTRGTDGMFRDASGVPVAPIEIRTRTHPLREKVQQVIADEWRDVGLMGEPLVVPEQRINDREYQATYPGFYFRFGGPDENEFDSCCIPGPENNFSGNDGTRYKSAELDGLLQRFRTTIPRSERMDVLGQIMHHMTDQLVILPMYHEPEPALISNHLVGAAGRRADDVQTWNVQDWDLK
jgi:ABC-type transport system substrate-binding protein